MDYDVIVVGGGLAGLAAASHCKKGKEVLILSGKDSSSDKAQGGIAAAIGEGDSTSMHARDTLQAGNGLCDEKAVNLMVERGIERVNELKRLGLEFDQSLGREAIHSRNRILHIGDFTGEHVLAFMEKLTEDVPREKGRVVGLIKDRNRCTGVLRENHGTIEPLHAHAIILASGGFSALYSHTTTYKSLIGDGVLLAYHAGAWLSDLEFVQFHPTVFKEFLLSEILRGEGAIIINQQGERLMQDYPLQELSGRDVLSRIMQQGILKGEKFFLDATGIEQKFLKKRFSNIYRECLKQKVDITKDLVPVSPAAHYTMGGVSIDLDGRTNVEGLFACGEVSCTKVHGSNRLSSNSLLEALVFGARAGKNASEEKGENRGEHCLIGEKPTEHAREVMWKNCGIIRNEKLLKEGMSNNPGELAELVIKCALARKESRGAHYREDFPNKMEKPMHSLVRIDSDGVVFKIC